MGKVEFVKCLEAEGYKPVIENGVVMIVTVNQDDYNKMRELAKKEGFKGSFGWRLTNLYE